ncbi:MAG: peptidoglycan-binding protein [Rhodospirillales bacterium]|nr:peptidoglycan-binding protein [Rhodospirillales bacterium]
MPIFPLIGLLAGLLILPASDAIAARAKDKMPVGALNPLELPAFNAMVQRVQRALAEAGYFRGLPDGHFNEETNKAIRTYQRREGLPQTGIADKNLAIHIETSAKVQSLLKQLQRQRLNKMDEARAALLANPQTRDLVSDPERRDKRASPGRDPSECFNEPSPECLLEEASQSAIAIFKTELRDWAFSEILVAEAKAGLVVRAMDTVRLIGDPRLIMVALRDIAAAQAAAGRPVEALAAADIIPDASKRLEALAAIATIQADRGNLEGAATSAHLLLDGLSRIDDSLKRFSLASGAVTVLARAGKNHVAETELAKIRVAAEAEEDTTKRSAALRHVANSLAETGNPGLALDMLKDLPDASERTPVLVSAATAQARAGHPEQAIITAGSIEAVRYRAVVLTRIGLAQAKAGDIPGGRKTLGLALAAAATIERPYAKAYAYERIALALMELDAFSETHNFDLAIDTAGLISDGKLRAQTLWTLAIGQRTAGDGPGADETMAMAEDATSEIKSSFTRVWMFSEISLAHLSADRTSSAWAAFNRALTIAEGIGEAWGRARALARLASTLSELSEHVEKQ